MGSWGSVVGNAEGGVFSLNHKCQKIWVSSRVKLISINTEMVVKPFISWKDFATNL